MKKYYIIDFDSTFVRIETLDQLAKIALRDNKNKTQITEQIVEITKQGMEGEISFPESLQKRLDLFQPTQGNIDELMDLLQKEITPSFIRNKEFFEEHKDQIYIISGGFHEYINPIVKTFGIADDHILANQFQWDAKGIYIGFDKENPLSQTQGKVKAIEKLDLQGEIIVIGDGYTDYEIKKEGKAEKFYLFIENVKRESLIQYADRVILSFDEIVRLGSKASQVEKKKVLLLEQIHELARIQLEKYGYEVEEIQRGLSNEELLAKIEAVTALGIRSKTQVTEEILNRAKKLKIIGAYCIGTNNIDLEACEKRNVVVQNAPFQNTRSVAELVMGEIIMLARQIFVKSQKLHQGIWDKSTKGSFEIRGKKLGIIGYGNIGTQVSVLAEVMGMQVYYYDIADKLAYGNAHKCENISQLLRTVDVITLHVDGRKENKNLIGRKEFDLMKDGVLLLNLSRGFIVDIDCLAEYIKNGKVKGAAIDVYPEEPHRNGEQLKTSLQGLNNVILTPHIGGSTEEAQEQIAKFVTDKMIQYLST